MILNDIYHMHIIPLLGLQYLNISKEDKKCYICPHICTLLKNLVYENKMIYMISKVEKE